jgi:hypothetical protein
VTSWAYAVLCLTVPQLWAVVLVRGFAVWTRRRELEARRRAASPPKDFTI